MKKGKAKEEALDIHNKIKIITSSDEIFKLWKTKVQGEQVVDTKK
jgi:hypothetical protein